MDALAVDVDLSRALQANDRRRAATLLVTHYASDVFALCRAIVRDRSTAEDLAQDAFQKALVALPQFRGESSSRTWLLAIARNTCLDHLRRQKSAPFEDDDGETDAHASTEAPVLDVIVRQEDVERALAPLDPNERAIVVLFHGHGVGYPELAQAFGVGEGALRMRMSRATQKMREALGKEPVQLRARLGAASGAAAPTPARAPAPSPRASPAMPPMAAAAPRAPYGGGPPGAPPAGGAPPPSPFGAPPAQAPLPAAARAEEADGAASIGSLGAPMSAPPDRGEPATKGGAGIFGRMKRALGFEPPPPAQPAASPRPLHDDAPQSLLDRLFALADAQ
jgi:RNA polymerase sigma-70 factor (ECF subfamily)